MRGGKRKASKSQDWVSGVCSTGKRSHTSRNSAKEHSRQLHGEHLREYRCDECSMWHVGHLPRAVMEGLMTARSHYSADSRLLHEPP